MNTHTDGTPLRQALEALDGNRGRDVASLLHAQLEAESTDPVLFSALGIALGRVGDVQGSLLALEKAHYLQPDNPHILYNYGLALEHAGLVREALLRFQAVLRLQPDHELARRQVALHSGREGPDFAVSPEGHGAPAVARSFVEDRPAGLAPGADVIAEREFGRSPLPQVRHRQSTTEVRSFPAPGPATTGAAVARPTVPQPVARPWQPPAGTPSSAEGARPAEAGGATAGEGGRRSRWVIDERIEGALQRALNQSAVADGGGPGSGRVVAPPTPLPGPAAWAEDEAPVPGTFLVPAQLRGGAAASCVSLPSGSTATGAMTSVETVPEPDDPAEGGRPSFWAELVEFSRAPLAVWLDQPGVWFACFAVPNALAAGLLSLGTSAQMPGELAILAWLLALALGLAPLLSGLAALSRDSDDSEAPDVSDDGRGPGARLRRILAFTVPVVMCSILPFCWVASLSANLNPTELVIGGLLLAAPVHALAAPWLALATEPPPGANHPGPGVAALVTARTWTHLAMIFGVNVVLGGALWFVLVCFHAVLRVQGQVVEQAMLVVELSFFESLWGITVGVAGFDALNQARAVEDGTDAL